MKRFAALAFGVLALVIATGATSAHQAKDGLDEFIHILFANKQAYRLQAIRALGEIGDKRAGPELVKLLEDEFSEIHSATLKALGQIKYKPAVPRVLSMLKDGGKAVRRDAILALGAIGDTRAVEPLLKAWKPGSIPGTHADKIVIALGQLGDPRAISLLLAIVKENSNFIKTRAIAALGRIGDERATMNLVQLLHVNPQSITTLKTIEALGRIKDPRAVKSLASMLDSSFHREPVLKALAEINGEEAQAVLLERINHKNRFFRIAVIQTLAAFRTQKVKGVLQKLATSAPEHGIRRQAELALEGIGAL